MKIIKYIKNHKTKSVILSIILFSIIGMAITGTLSYPYILIDRQVVLTKYCSDEGIRDITTKEFGFRIVGPEGYCLLPHRMFPEDGSIQVVPKGSYSVINEYAKGTIIEAAQATILFEQTEKGRSPKELVEKMGQGGFLKEAKISEFKNRQNLDVLLVSNSTGLDEESAAHFNWAFIANPNGKILASVLTSHPETPEVFNYIVDNISALK